MTMTVRDLIIYILTNGLEAKPVYEDGHILGFMNTAEAAVKFGVSSPTIITWFNNGQLDGVKLGGEIYFPQNAENPIKGKKNEEKNITSNNNNVIHDLDADLCRRIIEDARRAACCHVGKRGFIGRGDYC
jgi:hypothetical protein